MSLFKEKKMTSAIKPAFNVGCLMDIPTGKFIQGLRGNWVLNAGWNSVNSVTAPGNSFKTELWLYLQLMALKRTPQLKLVIYDSENSATYDRIYKTGLGIFTKEELDEMVFGENPRIILLRAEDMAGDEFWDEFKKTAEDNTKDYSKKPMTLPMYDMMTGEAGKQIQPILCFIDSLSLFDVSAVQEKIVDKNSLGESGNNMLFMRQGVAKTMLITQLPRVTSMFNTYVSMVAHIGQKFEMDAYAAKPPELTFARNGTEKKGVPGRFDYINSNLLEIYNAKPMLQDKKPIFPLEEADRVEGTDLFLIHGVASRNKNGPSGVQYGVITSQALGIQPTLTEYYFLKEHGKFGFTGNDRNFQMALCPETTLMRTTLRVKFDADPILRRAVNIQSEMMQMRKHWRGLDTELHCTPEELYADLAAKGYDWATLLNTRGWWTYEENIKTSPRELSTMDLLMMRKGEYHPYWLEEDKKTIKKEYINCPDAY